MNRAVQLGLLSTLALFPFQASGADQSGHDRAEPQYNERGELRRPSGFERWVFVGANLGLQYHKAVAATAPAKKAERPEPPRGDFHHVYINPAAYEHYRQTGRFPDKTMLVMEVYEAKEKEPQNIISRGLFPGRRLHFEVAVKNRTRPDGATTDWAYYAFPADEPAAKAFDDASCYRCHLKHADDDNVWVQFYPILRAHQKARTRD